MPTEHAIPALLWGHPQIAAININHTENTHIVITCSFLSVIVTSYKCSITAHQKNHSILLNQGFCGGDQSIKLIN